MRDNSIKKGGFLFYGWYIIIASFFILFFTSGARYSIGVMFKPMISEFGAGGFWAYVGGIIFDIT